MAINPNEYTISYSQLIRSTTIRDRVNMAQSDNTFYSQLAQVLTPTQMANLFPRYYRDRLPDISGFQLATSQIAAGKFGEGLPSSPITSGASSEYVSPRTTKSKKELEAESSLTGEVNKKKLKDSLLAQGINIDEIFKLVRGGTNLNDPRLKYLKDIPPDKLRQMGIEIYQDERGRNLVRRAQLPIENMTKQQIKEEMRKAGSGMRAGLNEDSRLIDYKSKKIAKELGISDREYNAYRQAIAEIESEGGTYNIRKGGASGKHAGAYQFKEVARIDAARVLGVELPTLDQFVADPKMQEEFMDAFTFANHKTLMSSDKYKNMTAQEKLEILAYAHNQGAKATLEYLKTGVGKKDGFQTPAIKFSTNVRDQLEETKDQTSYDPDKEYTDEEVQEFITERVKKDEASNVDELTEALSEKFEMSTEEAEQVITSSTSSLGFGPGEEETYLGGISNIDVIPTSGGTTGSREFGRIYTDPKTGKQYPIRPNNKTPGHAGTDFGAEQGFKTGTPWKAHMGGEVIGGGYSVGREGKGYGYYIDVKFDDGSIHRYAHNDENVAKGKFEKGKTLFKVGASGVESGWAHAHAEVWLPKTINGKEYTADELYRMSAGMGSKTEKGLLYRSNPREYWQSYEQQQLALREKYLSLQERVSEDPSALDDISPKELQVLSEKGSELYPELSKAASKKISQDGTSELVQEEPMSVPQSAGVDPESDEETESEVDKDNPYLGKSVEELRKMTSEQYDLKESILKKSGKIYYEDSDWLKADIEEKKMYDALREANRRESENVEVQPDTGKAAVDEAAGLYEGGIINTKDNLKVVREDGSPTGIRVASDETAVIIPPDERRKARDFVSLDGTDQRTGLDSMDETTNTTKPGEAPLNQAKMSTAGYSPSNQSTIPSSLGAIDYSPSAIRAFARDKYGFHSAPRTIYAQK